MSNGQKKPWQRPGWLADRLRELAYQVLSWPYLTATALTVLYLRHPTNAVARDAMIAAWIVALGRREFARFSERWGGPK